MGRIIGFFIVVMAALIVVMYSCLVAASREDDWIEDQYRKMKESDSEMTDL